MKPSEHAIEHLTPPDFIQKDYTPDHSWFYGENKKYGGGINEEFPFIDRGRKVEKKDLSRL